MKSKKVEVGEEDKENGGRERRKRKDEEEAIRKTRGGSVSTIDGRWRTATIDRR